MNIDFTPVHAFRFEVEINGETMRCQNVEGIEVEVQHTPYRVGDSDDLHMVMVPGMQKFSNTVTIKKAVVEDDEDIIDMISELLEEKEYYEVEDKFEVEIRILTHEGEVVQVYNLIGCSPKKFTAPTLDAMENKLAIETLVLSYDSFTVSSDGA